MSTSLAVEPPTSTRKCPRGLLRTELNEVSIWGPLGKRKISYAKTVFCTDYHSLSVMRGIYPVPV